VENDPLNNADLTVIATNVEQTPEEDILEVAKEMISLLDESAVVSAAIRLRNRDQSSRRPALVKIGFESVQDKIRVLREKRRLRETEKYRNVFLRGSKTHTERLLELNARTLLNELPHGKDFRVAANGRIIRKTNSAQQHSQQENDR
jgi:hypothetical protein